MSKEEVLRNHSIKIDLKTMTRIKNISTKQQADSKSGRAVKFYTVVEEAIGMLAKKEGVE